MPGYSMRLLDCPRLQQIQDKEARLSGLRQLSLKQPSLVKPAFPERTPCIFSTVSTSQASKHPKQGQSTSLDTCPDKVGVTGQLDALERGINWNTRWAWQEEIWDFHHGFFQERPGLCQVGCSKREGAENGPMCGGLWRCAQNSCGDFLEIFLLDVTRGPVHLIIYGCWRLEGELQKREGVCCRLS